MPTHRIASHRDRSVGAVRLISGCFRVEGFLKLKLEFLHGTDAKLIRTNDGVSSRQCATRKGKKRATDDDDDDDDDGVCLVVRLSLTRVYSVRCVVWVRE